MFETLLLNTTVEFCEKVYQWVIVVNKHISLKVIHQSIWLPQPVNILKVTTVPGRLYVMYR